MSTKGRDTLGPVHKYWILYWILIFGFELELSFLKNIFFFAKNTVFTFMYEEGQQKNSVLMTLNGQCVKMIAPYWCGMQLQVCMILFFNGGGENVCATP